MKLTSVLPEKFGSLAEDVERGEAAWKEVRGKGYFLLDRFHKTCVFGGFVLP